ncbi:MAG: hypothetical protein EOO37_03750, partial [Cytophagaceae bacterium]
MIRFNTLCQGSLALLSLSVLSACEKQDTTSLLGASVGLDNKVFSSTTYYLPSDFSSASGGSNTTNQSDAQAFNQPSPALSPLDAQYHATGLATFEQMFGLQQLAPLWNHNKCSGCHVNGGRSPLGTDPSIPQLLFRVSVPGLADDGGPNP